MCRPAPAGHSYITRLIRLAHETRRFKGEPSQQDRVSLGWTRATVVLVNYDHCIDVTAIPSDVT